MKKAIIFTGILFLAAILFIHWETMTITSGAFQNNGEIPQKYGCSGQGINPSLTFSGVPAAAKSLVLIVDDPDAPLRTFTHWIVYNIDPKTTDIQENSVPAGAKQGLNSARKEPYVPPCPPTGTHHYHFTLYALDAIVPFDAMQGHILETAKLVGLFHK